MSERIARHLVVHGRVQGVFFRDSLREQAVTHAVSGWARNRSDGTVEALLEGSLDAVERVIAFCREGPPRADVGQVEVGELEPEGLSGFETR